jgi:hypothetical protein
VVIAPTLNDVLYDQEDSYVSAPEVRAGRHVCEVSLELPDVCAACKLQSTTLASGGCQADTQVATPFRQSSRLLSTLLLQPLARYVCTPTAPSCTLQHFSCLDAPPPGAGPKVCSEGCPPPVGLAGHPVLQLGQGCAQAGGAVGGGDLSPGR